MQKFGVKNNQKLQLFQNVPNQKKEQLGEKIVQVVSVAFATFSISGVIDTEWYNWSDWYNMIDTEWLTMMSTCLFYKDEISVVTYNP